MFDRKLTRTSRTIYRAAANFTWVTPAAPATGARAVIQRTAATAHKRPAAVKAAGLILALRRRTREYGSAPIIITYLSVSTINRPVPAITAIIEIKRTIIVADKVRAIPIMDPVIITTRCPK